MLSEQEIRNWLDAHANVDGDVTVTPDGLVNVKGRVCLTHIKAGDIDAIPFQFGTVTGDFCCILLPKLQTCVGFPLECDRLVITGGPYLRSLVGCPQRCQSFELDSFAGSDLVGAPKSATEIHIMWCSWLKSLNGIPEYGMTVNIRHCSNLETIDAFPACMSATINYCKKLRSLTGIHQCDNLTLIVCPAVTEWPDSTNLSRLSRFNYQCRMRAPDANTASRLIQLNTEIITTQHAKWLTVVKNVQKPDDLLAALSAFEKYFKVPYTFEAPTLPITDLVGIEL